MSKDKFISQKHTHTLEVQSAHASGVQSEVCERRVRFPEVCLPEDELSRRIGKSLAARALSDNKTR